MKKINHLSQLQKEQAWSVTQISSSHSWVPVIRFLSSVHNENNYLISIKGVIKATQKAKF